VCECVSVLKCVFSERHGFGFVERRRGRM
jgi:hypothetical protein